MSTDAIASSTPASSASAPIEVSPGDSGPVTFDDLNAADDAAKTAKKEAKSEIKEAVKQTVKELQKPDQPKKAKESDEKSKEAKAKEGGEEKVKDLETKDKPKEKKAIKAKLGDKEIDLDPDALIPVKINGKEELVSLNELRADKAGKVEWDKRFTQLDKERKEFKAKTGQISEKITNIFKETDPEMKLYRMAELAGQDPMTFRNKWLEDGTKLLEKWYAMSDAEKEADAKDFENKILKRKLESRESEDKVKHSLSELDQKVSALRKAHNVSEELFIARYDELEAMSQSGNFKQEITPEFIVESIAKDKLWEAAENKLNALNVSLPVEARGKILLDLVDNAYKLGLSEADIADAAAQIWGSRPKEEIIQEKVEQREEFLSGKKAAKKSATNSEVWSFEQI